MNPVNDLENKVVLVTGGSRGIGEAIVRRFAAQKAKVYFTYQSSENAAKNLVSSIGKAAGVFCLPCDGRNKKQVEDAVEQVLGSENRLDVLVNNAGIIRDALFLTMSDEDWDEVLATNLGGTYHFCRAVARQMLIQKSGRIINISSVVGELGGVGQANYAASKGAINALTKSLAAEFASKQVTVNAVSPGMVDTKMSEPVRSLLGEKIKERIPSGYFATPEDIADTVLFLASDKARYITGQIISVDGGLSLLSRR